MKNGIYYLIASLVFVFSGCKKNIETTREISCIEASQPNLHPKKEQFDQLIASFVKKGLPGISLLVEDSNGIYIGAAGYADLGNNSAFTPCHISKAASITKMMMGAVTLLIVEEGKLNLDDPLEKYIDEEILDKLDKGRGQTVRKLMNHTTGIYDVITSSDFYLAVLNNPNKEWSQLELLRFAYGKEGYTLGNPYEAYYSNTNTLLLSMVLEKATGIPHEQLLRERLWKPLQMNQTFYRGREPIPNYAAQGYFDLHNNGEIVNISNLITGSGNGYGGVFSNVFDLRIFLKSLLIDKTLLQPSTLEEMMQFKTEDADFNTGLGLIKKFTNKAAYGIGHTGRDLGYSANLFYFPERGASMIFFVNYGTNGSSALKDIFLQFESELADKIIE